MENKPLISLCIPTNGVIYLFAPVLESIYKQECDETKFEVIVTDNGNNEDFKEWYNDKWSPALVALGIALRYI